MRSHLAEVTVSVTLTQGTETLTVNTTDADAAFLGQIPSAVRTMTGTWQQASGRDHPTPGKLTLDLILDTPEHPAIDYESEVVVMVSIVGRDPIMFWRGWLDDIQITRRVIHDPDTRAETVRWDWSLTAGDVLARAAATKINMPPLPVQRPFRDFVNNIEGRTGVIRDATPIPLVSPNMPAGVMVKFDDWQEHVQLRARDVDNVDVLSLMQDIATAGAMQVHEHDDGLTFKHSAGTRRLAWVKIVDAIVSEYFDDVPNMLGSSVVWSGPGGDWDLLNDANVVEIGSTAIVETSRRINRATLLNEVSIGYYNGPEGNPTARTRYERNTSRQASTSQHRMGSDWWKASTTAKPELMSFAARSWLAETERPTRAIAETSILTGKLPADVLEDMVSVRRRGALGIAILNEPADLPVSWRPIGGTATVEAGRIAVDLTLEPASMAGQEPLRFDEIPAGVTTTFEDGTPVYVEPTFARLNGAEFPTFGGMWHVNKSAHELYTR